ncbi:hypothetical protein [Muriicola soli]|uniref:Uncharacterized protein n=1 Tax=Muriicola soli TaxID=2507538 RepID=A0A411E660_9FLAO|nr:hypothetical protein [Muriicola soli]QBA63196.1 hypothetical protein EQY75_00665 [Muriicola soli]
MADQKTNKLISQKDIAKSKKVLVWYLIIVVLLFVSIIYLFIRYTEVSKENVEINEDNEEHVERLAELRKETNATIDSLIEGINKRDSILLAIRSVDNNDLTNRILSFNSSNIKNSKFIVTVYSFGVQKRENEEIEDYLKSKGYSVSVGGDYSSGNKKPTWMSSEPAVFYYSPNSKGQAEVIAKEVSLVTERTYAVRRGAGKGVIKGLESTTFFIHNINSTAPSLQTSE